MARRKNDSIPFHRYSRSSEIQKPTIVNKRNHSVATSNPAHFEKKYDWMANKTPKSFSSRNICYYSKYGGAKKNATTSSLWKLLPAFILMSIPWIPIRQTKIQIHVQKQYVQKLVKEQQESIQELDRCTQSIKELRSDVETLTRDNESMFRDVNQNGETAMDFDSKQYLEVEKDEETYLKRIDALEKHIQDESYKEVENRYGSGPHQVKVVLEDNNGIYSHFVIELAMLMEMPHAVDHFLQMVDSRLWEGLALVHGTGSDVITATPRTMDGHSWAGQRFVDANLTQLAFAEFSSTYPPPHHHKYSVAFAGRPGGPDFYINLEDEVEIHQHESTFGMVLEGRDVLDRFFLQRDHPETDSKNRAQMMTIHRISLLAP